MERYRSLIHNYGSKSRGSNFCSNDFFNDFYLHAFKRVKRIRLFRKNTKLQKHCFVIRQQVFVNVQFERVHSSFISNGKMRLQMKRLTDDNSSKKHRTWEVVPYCIRKA